MQKTWQDMAVVFDAVVGRLYLVFESHVLPRIAGSSMGVVRGFRLCQELSLLCHIISNDKIFTLLDKNFYITLHFCKINI